MKEIFDRPYDTLHNSIPFSQISEADYEPAIQSAIAEAKAEIDAIAHNPEPPTFDNTIVELEASGDKLNRVMSVFGPMQSCMASDNMMEIMTRVAPKLSAFSTSVNLNRWLWERVKSVYENRDSFDLTPEDNRLLDETYESFQLSGATLEEADRDRYREINAEMSELTTQFGQNVLRELNALSMTITDAADLDGLPQRIVDAAAEKAREMGREGEWVITLDQPTYSAFMRHSTRRELREKLWRMYNTRNTSGERNNIPVIERIVDLRRQKAQLLGFSNYAELSLKRTMAGNVENVMQMLDSLREDYREPLESEMAELREFSGLDELKPWDYSFYFDRLRREKIGYDVEALRPYFPLEKVIDGVLGLATTLYGITFRPADVEVYHPDVKVFEVIDTDGSYLGLLYTDFFPRDNKRPGAWMTDFAPQWVDTDGDHRPHVSLVMNFTKPTATAPSLLSPDEVRTFLHEFGHALHGLFSRTRYSTLSGTNVYRDFVELPSQFNENFLTRREFLDTFARHYLTGEPIPEADIERIIADSRFGVAYACWRQLGFGYVDMAWHTITEPVTEPVGDAADFERRAAAPVQIFEPVEGALFSPQFSHIFAGGYAAGYYSYKWSEMLDADAFEMFLENGVTDRATANRFRHEILERGDSEDPMTLYVNFRGKAPSPEALLRRDALR